MVMPTRGIGEARKSGNPTTVGKRVAREPRDIQEVRLENLDTLRDQKWSC